MLKQRITQKLTQKINPLQIQLIKLIELPTHKLEQRVKEELEKNPVLEEGAESDEFDDNTPEEENITEDNDEFSLEDYLNDEDYPDYKLSSSNYSKDDKREEIPFAGSTTFRESLVSQLGLRDLSDKEKALTEYLIGNIDDDGYLRRDLEAVVDDLAFNTGVDTSEEELTKLLFVIQDFEPLGVGARNLRECLLIQLRAKLKEDCTEEKNNAYLIIRNSFDEFTRKHYEKIQRKLKLDDHQMKAAIDEILRLNPKPGGTVAEPFVKTADKIIPDFTLDLIDGELQLSLNSKNVPDLRVNRSYVDMIEDIQSTKGRHSKEQKDAIAFVKYKLNSAKSFIDAVRQRQQTLMFTMTAIVQLQKEYFLTGEDSNLRPMILKDVADITGLDISTISRVSNSKYVQTWFGIFPLKHFFTGSMQTSSGEEVSTSEVKNYLQELVDNENKSKPLTDDELVELLTEKNYKIARRTVAKYRGQLNIPVARLRKEL